ncbi:MAG: hypothetical protein QMD85_00845, partial [Candidatus Aenigmarchaeota archaeon]|nr:hypothetical protein [Candidatus Aenigmarchaeota archaeon]
MIFISAALRIRNHSTSKPYVRREQSNGSCPTARDKSNTCGRSFSDSSNVSKESFRQYSATLSILP